MEMITTGVRIPKKRNPLDALMSIQSQTFDDQLCRLYSIDALAWEYIDTVSEVCARQRRRDLKEMSRALRAKRRDHDRFRGAALQRIGIESEQRRAGVIDSGFADDFDRLYYGIFNDLGKLRLSREDKELAIAINQALALYEATCIIAREIDEVMTAHGVPPIQLGALENEFIDAGNMMKRWLRTRGMEMSPNARLSASIIANRVKTIEVIHE